MERKLAEREIVLLGVGHTHAHIVRMWRMNAFPRTRLTCVTDMLHASYSGMLPGVLAGQYEPAQMMIDLVRFGAASNTRLIHSEVVGMDVGAQQIHFDDRPPIRYDVCSIGIGSNVSLDVPSTDARLLMIKPMQTLLSRLEALVNRLVADMPERVLKVAVLGAGVGGVEIALCLPNWFRARGISAEVHLLSSNDAVGQGSAPSTQRRIRQVLPERGVSLSTNARVVEVDDRTIRLADGRSLEADVILVATGASAAPLLSRLGLATDEAGFLLTRKTLQSVSDGKVFAVGDCGSMQDSPVPKAGVYAVRQGPVLWRNLSRCLAQEPLEPYRPQSDFLKLINVGDGRAIGELRGLSWLSRSAWWLKNRIDTRFMEKYQAYEPAMMNSEPEDHESTPIMRCTGCGGKIGGSILSRVLNRLEIPPHSDVIVGLDRPDDAAVLRTHEGQPVTTTVDFFAAPLDDPFLVGRIAALNAASDLWTMGAKPSAALAIVSVPVGAPRAQEDLLFELLSGALVELRKMGATLVGGHTIESNQVTIGFTMIAMEGNQATTKDRMQNGDHLVLTKPLGTGILLAAHMQAQCQAPWYDALVTTMLQSNQAAAALAGEQQLQAVTDITGFGLAGHLLEMLRASQRSADVDLSQIPLLPGTAELIQAGVASTLSPANRDAEAAFDAPLALRQEPTYEALFDPQTGGGLLLSVPADRVATVLSQLHAQGYKFAADIGTVAGNDAPRIRLGRLSS